MTGAVFVTTRARCNSDPVWDRGRPRDARREKRRATHVIGEVLRLRLLLVGPLALSCGPTGPPALPPAISSQQEPAGPSPRPTVGTPAPEDTPPEPAAPVAAEVDTILLLGETTTFPRLNSPAFLRYAVEPEGIVDVRLSPDSSHALIVARNFGAACVVGIDRQGHREVRGYRVIAYVHHHMSDDLVEDARRSLAAAGKLDEGRRRCDCIVAPRAPGCPPASAP